VKLLRPSEELEEVEQSLKDSLRKPLAWKVVMLLRTMGEPFSSLALHELGERAVRLSSFFWFGADDFVNDMILGLTQASMSQVLFAFASSGRRRAPSRRNSGQWLRRTGHRGRWWFYA
jgi:hypothetical protein